MNVERKSFKGEKPDGLKEVCKLTPVPQKRRQRYKRNHPYPD
jgi:hypothetical protein